MKNYIKVSELISAYTIGYNSQMNRGYGCGYVEIKKEHPLYKMAQVEQIDGGSYFYFQIPNFTEEITLCEFNDDVLTLGFDSAHSWNNYQNSSKEIIENKTIDMYNICNKFTYIDVQDAKYKKVSELMKELNKI